MLLLLIVVLQVIHETYWDETGQVHTDRQIGGIKSGDGGGNGGRGLKSHRSFLHGGVEMRNAIGVLLGVCRRTVAWRLARHRNGSRVLLNYHSAFLVSVLMV